MSTEPIRVAVVMDHPAQQFTRSIQFLAEEPDLQLRFHYSSVALQVHGPDFRRRSSALPDRWGLSL